MDEERHEDEFTGEDLPEEEIEDTEETEYDPGEGPDDPEDPEDPDDSEDSDEGSKEESNEKDSEKDNHKPEKEKKKSDIFSASKAFWDKLPLWITAPIGFVVFLAAVLFLQVAFDIPMGATGTLLLIGLIGRHLYKRKVAQEKEEARNRNSSGSRPSAQGKTTPVKATSSRGVQKVPDNVEKIDPDNISVGMDDIAGNEEAKREVQQLIEFLENPARFNRLGAKVPKGVLLHGPPGTGKTMLAKAIAREAGVPFFTPTSSSFAEMFVGIGPRRVRDLFSAARAAAPAIVFIDEIDAVGKQRSGRSDGGSQEHDNTLNEILQNMDGFANDGVDIIVIGATNRPDTLDPAITRPGRLSRHIKVDLPDVTARQAIFKVHAEGARRRVEREMNNLLEDAKVALEREDEDEAAHISGEAEEVRSVAENGVFAKDLDFASLAKMTYGCSGADIENIVNEALIGAIEADVEQATMEEVIEAIDRVMAGTKRRNMLSDEEKRRVAYHEAGHALVGYLLPDADTPHRITIVARDKSLGHTMAAPDRDKALYEDKELMAKLSVLVGGRIAEEIKYPGTKTTGSGNDYEKANQIARDMITRYGMAKDEELRRKIFAQTDGGTEALSLPEEDKRRISSEIHELLKDAEDLARETLLENIELFDDFTDHLVTVESMDEEDIHDFVKKHRPKGRKVVKKLRDAAPGVDGGTRTDFADVRDDKQADSQTLPSERRKKYFATLPGAAIKTARSRIRRKKN